MSVKIPQNKQWSQLNKGDLLGTLYATRNIDLNTPGILKLAQRTRYIGQTSSGNFLDAHAIILYNNTYWICSTRMFSMTRALASFAEDASANTPSSGPITDGCVWNNDMYVAKTSRISKLATTTWTQDWSNADFANTSSSFPHPVEPNVTNTSLLVGDGNLLKQCDSSGVISTALTLPANFVINWIRRGTNVNYIGLNSKNGGTGAVAVWDGLATTLEANYLIPLKASTPNSGVLDESGVFWIIQSDGRLMRFNGSGFTYEAELPPFRDYLLSRDWGGSLTIAQRVLNRGMQIVRGKIHISVMTSPSTSPSGPTPNFLDGVWVYDPDNKAFYHRFATSNANTVTDFGQNRGTSQSAIAPLYEGDATQNYVYPAVTVGGTLITAARVSGATPATQYRVLVSCTTGENRGQFTTCRIESPVVTNTNIALWCKFQGLTTATDKIVFKYRTTYRDPINILSGGIAWTSSTTFTTTDTGMANVVVGDEILVLSGNGAGCTSHISNISYSNPTYTVTLDEALTGVVNTNSGEIMIDNWRRIPTEITYLDTKGYKQITIPKQESTTWIQIKGELRGEGSVVGIQELQIISNENQKAI